tara:strand:- start:866 stop:1603 length:738 start_codon:yes stop_codon:yes gene_type:complete
MVSKKSILNKSDYLDITYSEAKAPRTSYPTQLANKIQSDFYKKCGKLIDLGCGRGDFLDAFYDLGFDVHGVDISPNIKNIIPNHKDRVKNINLETDNLDYFYNSHFDFVFSKSVIEHMRDPSGLFTSAYDCLKPGGVAVIMTPSWAHTYKNSFYIDYTHVTPFTKPSLEDAFLMAGFKQVSVQHFTQLPYIWNKPYLKPFLYLISKMPIPYSPYNKVPWSVSNKLNKLVRFSKEVMLLGVAIKDG